MANLPTKNNNPGDLRSSATGFQQFDTPQEGGAALLNDLTAKMTGKSKTGINGSSSLAQFASVWAPPSDNNNTAKYAADLANQLGVSPDTQIGTLMPRIGEFASAISKNEGYQSPAAPAPAPNGALASTLFGTLHPETADASSGPQAETTQKKSSIWPTVATVGGLIGAGALAIGSGGTAIPEELAAASSLGLGGAEGFSLVPEAASAVESGLPTISTEAAKTPGLLSKAGSALKSVGGNILPALGLEGVQEGMKGAKGLYDSVTGQSDNSSGDSQGQDTSGLASQIDANADQNAQLAQQQSEAIKDSQTAAANTAQAYQTVLGQTAQGQKMIQNPLFLEGTHALANNGITPDEENGRYSTQENQAKVSERINTLNDEENQLHDAEGATGNLSELGAEAKEFVRKTMPSTQWDDADAIIDKDLVSYRTKFGSGEGNYTVPLGSKGIGLIRKEGYSAYDHNSSAAANGARKALGSAANAHMLKKSRSSELIQRLHKEKQKLVHGKKILKHLDGKKVTQKAGVAESLLRHYGKYAGLAIGDKLGGALGAVIGEMVGTHLSRAVDKKYGTNIFESKSIKKGIELLQSKNPEVHAEVIRELEKHGIRKAAEQQEVIKTSHQMWQEEKFKERKASKREEYQARKKGILETALDDKKESKVEKAAIREYEPYTNDLPTIDYGKPGVSKHKKTVKGLMTIR